MSTRFDDEVEASWGRFEERLAQLLRELDEGSLLVELAEEPEGGAAPYVQFMAYDGRLRAEVSSNAYLAPDLALGPIEVATLQAHGWHEPDEDESPNFWHDVPRDCVDVVVPMVVGALRQVFGVLGPEFLMSEQMWPEDPDDSEEPESQDDDEVGETDEQAEAGQMPVIAVAEDHLDLERLVGLAITHIHGTAVRDDDGDFVIGTSVAPIWVRVLPERPVVRVYSFVVCSVRDVRQARIEIGILNQRQDFWKFTVADGVITATYDLPAMPFVAPLLMWTLDRLAEQLDDLAGDAATRVGGRLWADGLEQGTA